MFIGIILYAVSQPSPVANVDDDPVNTNTPTPTPSDLMFTITGEVGAEQIKITNLNTPATIILTQSDFPATFNCDSGDVLTFSVTAKDGYTFNAWLMDDGTWQSKNPLTLKVSNSFTMEACFLINDEEIVLP